MNNTKNKQNKHYFSNMKPGKKNIGIKAGAIALTAATIFQVFPASAYVYAKDTEGPHWAFTQNAGNLPDQKGSPDDDLNLFVNYDYLSQNQDVEDQASPIIDHASEATQELWEILEDPSDTSHDLSQLQIFYEQAQELKNPAEEGTSLIKPYLDRIKNASSIKELNDVLTAEDFPFEVFFSSSIGAADMRKNGAVVIVPQFMSADSVDGPEFMQDDFDTTKAIFNAMTTIESRVKSRFSMAYLEDSDYRYSELEDFEKQYGKFAFYSALQDKNGLPSDEWKSLYNEVTYDQLKSEFKNFPIADILASENRGQADLYAINCSKWLNALDILWTQDNLEILKAIAQIQIANESAPYCNDAYRLYEAATISPEELSSELSSEISEMYVGLAAEEMCYLLQNFKTSDIIETLTDLYDSSIRQLAGDYTDFIVFQLVKYAEKLDQLDGTALAAIIPGDTFINEIAKYLGDHFLEFAEEYLQAMVSYDTSYMTAGSADLSIDTSDFAYNLCDQPDTFAHLLAATYEDDVIEAGARERLADMTAHLIDSYKSQIAKNTWLEEESKDALTQKLDTMRLNILEPEGGFINYDGLHLKSTEEGGTLFENYLTVKEYVRNQQNEELNMPATSNWAWYYFSPMTVNCFYDTDTNSINILPGFLNSFFYQNSFTDEELLGKMGFVIGHEISHAFDYTGNHYDANAVLNDCLTEEDQQEYNDLVNRLAAYYDSIELEDGTFVDGDKIIAEATADLCSIGVILEYASTIPDFDYEAFYFSAAESWASVCAPGVYKIYTIVDNHPLDYLRTNVNVQMYQNFYDTFQVTKYDGMYLDEENRINIW